LNQIFKHAGGLRRGRKIKVKREMKEGRKWLTTEMV